MFKQFISLCLISISSLSAEFREINEWREVESTLVNYKEGDLVAFDLDFTLLMPEDVLFQPGGYYFFKKFFDASPVPKDEYYTLRSIINDQMNYKLLDGREHEIIKELQYKRCKVIALTAQRTGVFGVIDRMEEWRFKVLKNLNIDFSTSFEGTYYFPELSIKDAIPGFYKGILCSGDTSKATVLLTFLERISYRPNKVFFIDDNKEWVLTMEKALNNHGIDNLCIHYTKYKEFNGPLKEEIAEIQLKTLIKEKKWLSDSSLSH
jgi:hypothetical protein